MYIYIRKMWKLFEKVMRSVLEGMFRAFKIDVPEEKWTIIMQFLKFAVVGLSNTVIYWIVYYALILIGVHWIVASISGFVISILNSFFWNNRYVFGKADNKKRNLHYAFIKVFAANAVSGLGVNNLFLWIWIDVIDISPYIAPIINLFITVPINFLMNKYWAFRDENEVGDFMKKYKLVIFDLDGTLLDTSEGVLSSIHHALREMKLEIPNEKVLSTFIGPPIQSSFQKHFGLEGEDLDEITCAFRMEYEKKGLYKACLYPGMLEVLKELKNQGIQTAVATYKREDFARIVLEHFQLTPLLDYIFGADLDGLLSKKDIIKKCLDYGKVSPENAVMIGDTDFDALGAKELSMDFIGVTYGFGFRSKEDVMNYSYVGIVDSPSEIIEIINTGE